MKKILGLLLLVGLFSFTACKQGGESGADAGAEGAGTEMQDQHGTDAGAGGDHGAMPADTAAHTAPAGGADAPPAEGADKAPAH